MGSSAPCKGFLISELLLGEEADVGLLRLRSLEKRFEASAELILMMIFIRCCPSDVWNWNRYNTPCCVVEGARGAS